MRRIISLIAIISILFAFTACKADKEALSLTGETQLAPANKNEPVVADVPIEETKTGASTTDGKTSEQTTAKEIDEIVSRVLDELKNTTEVTTEMVTIPENKTVPLNVATKRGEGSLVINSALLKYEFGEIVFNYNTSDENAYLPIARSCSLEGKSGKKYSAGVIGGKDNTGSMEFYGITDFTDLSTVTLTYQFEGFDPVTVTFNIPV